MIIILHRGEGSLRTPKSDYGICARPLKDNPTVLCARRLLRSYVSRAGPNPRFVISFFFHPKFVISQSFKSTFHPRISTFVPSISLTICARFRRGGGVGEDRVRRLVVRQEGTAPLDWGMVSAFQKISQVLGAVHILSHTILGPPEAPPSI